MVATTIYDEEGEVMGMITSNGQIIIAAPSNVGQPTVAWLDALGAKVVIGIVAWDGAAYTPGLRNKGQLMNYYEPLLQGGPQFAGMNYSRVLFGKKEENPSSDESGSEDSPS